MSRSSPISLANPQVQEKGKPYTSYSPHRSRFYEAAIYVQTVDGDIDAKVESYSPSYHTKHPRRQHEKEEGEKDQDKYISEYIREHVYRYKHKEPKKSRHVQSSPYESNPSVRVVLSHRPDVPRRSGTASTYASTSTNDSPSASQTTFRPTFPFPFTPAPTPSSPLASALAPATATGTVHAHTYESGAYSTPSSVPASAPASSSAFRPVSASTVSSYYSCATGDGNIKGPEILEEFKPKQAEIPEHAEYVDYDEYPVYENYTENATSKIGRKRSGRDINTDIDLELGIVTDNIALDELERGKRRASFYPRPLSPLTPLHRGNSKTSRISESSNGRRLRKKDHEARAREARLKLQSRANTINGIKISTSSAYYYSPYRTTTKLKSHTSADHGQSIWAFCLGVIAVLTLLFLSNCYRNLGRILKSSSPPPPRTGSL